MNRIFSRSTKKAAAVILAAVLTLGLFAGCASNGGATTEKIDLSKALYTTRDVGAYELASGALYGGAADAKVVDNGFLDVLADAISRISATAYVIDFSGTRGEFDSTDAASEYAESYFEAKGIADIILQKEMIANGIWGALVDGEMADDIKTLWVNRYENLDGDTEYVVDISRNSKPLYTLRYIYNEGDSAPTFAAQDFAPGYDGREPAAIEIGAPAETGSASNMYFRGNMYRTGIFEQPVLGGVDFTFSISGKGIEGEVPGGFAGMFEGTVTIDGVTTSFTTHGNNIPVPLSMVEDPSEWYIGIARCPTNNPQDTTGYRNIFFIRTDYSEVVGLYMTYRSAAFSEWFDVVRVTKSEFDAAVADNNAKLTDFYAKIMLDAYGSRKEYNNLLAVIYNMFVGVEQSYLKKNLPEGIKTMSIDIRDYSECYMDESVSTLGQNEFWFFPDGRSTVTRLYEYDGTTAIAAVDFSTKQDDGYGGLYKGTYENGKWTIEVLKNDRIK